ncbi:restriction endonuclease subunit S [Trichocoleus sp. FACHB-262]|uniref:restriction endonuclease subunit S n=1 Tax=Trichocoleus sp. FACHB-262 TaxID=2692869 RepID=UPI00168768CB|nr:restriction endonuclease subunit S [Trichocoleus sp. FACHB-262]MBD2124768.1 restriction endonuclease subunit S [Trichocoleus sp. FACHB-262]
MSSLPTGWTIKPLGDVATLQRGFDLPVQHRIPSDVPVFAANGPVGTHNTPKVKGPGVVTGRSGTLGEVHYVETDYWPLNTALWVKDFHGNDPKWVARLLKWMRLETHTRGTGVPTLNRNLVHVVPVLVPPPEEQRRIAAILDRADAVRRKRQEAIALTEELLRSTFLEMFGDPITNPKGWEMKPLGSLCTIVRGGSPRPINEYLGGTVPWIKIGDGTDSDDIYISKTAEAIKPEGVKRSRYLEPGSLIFANCGVSLGFARILQIGGCIHDGWLAFSDIDQSLNKIYLLKLLNSITNHFRAIAPDGTQPNLNTSIMKEFNVPVPPLHFQENFSALTEELTSSKEQFVGASKESDNLFNSLLQRAFRGEL